MRAPLARLVQGWLGNTRLPAGTRLLLDCPLCFAPADLPAEVRARAPWLAAASGPAATAGAGGAGPAPCAERIGWRERGLAFWTGPRRRYVPGCSAVEVRLDLGASPGASSVPGAWRQLRPGAYAVEATARALSLFLPRGA